MATCCLIELGIIVFGAFRCLFIGGDFFFINLQSKKAARKIFKMDTHPPTFSCQSLCTYLFASAKTSAAAKWPLLGLPLESDPQ